jgi:hypothetical protein
MQMKGRVVLAGWLVGLVAMVGATQAAAAGSTTVLMFHSANQTQTAVGFNINSNEAPPIGSQYIITLTLVNAVPQFGKPAGVSVGRVLLDCTILSLNGPNGDGICSGIAHVPNGYITFDGNGGFSNSKHQYYAITGGVGSYASDRGQIRAGGGTAIVTLTS